MFSLLRSHTATATEKLNAQLIEAVEEGRDADVPRLIDAGASPDARKRVTLKVMVSKQSRGGSQWREDTVDCESALVLAILHARVGIVRMLLEKGAKVEGSVEWKIGNWWHGKWGASEWDRVRWRMTITFPSLLCLAIGEGGNLTSWDKVSIDQPFDGGRLQINLKGGTVTISHPVKMEDSCVTCKIQPNGEIVRLLLARGARVSDVELAAARKSPNKELLQCLEFDQCTKEALTVQLRELQSRSSVIEGNIRSKEHSRQMLQEKLSTFASNRTYLQDSGASIAIRHTSLSHRNAAFMRLTTGLR
ncbi:hypothetical protein M427DRAFT_60285, partial [Gonapodya prolifera JEL478]